MIVPNSKQLGEFNINKGKDNRKVMKVLERRNIINEFREGNIGAVVF